MTEEAQTGFQRSLESRFSITVEIPPPKGADPRKNLEVARQVSGKVAGINVTDNQRGMMRMSALAFSHLLLDAGCEPIWQVCARDRNRLALQSDFLGAASLGIKNVCLMTGDFPTLGDNPEAKPVYDLDSVQLIKLANDFSKGKNIHGKPLQNHPSFFIGGVVNPFFEPLELELIKLQKKIEAGARFFQTQPFFDIESLDFFLERAKPLGAKILVGVTPLKSERMINFLNENVLTKPIPPEISSRISRASNPAMEGLKIAAEFANSIREKVDGIHIMPISQLQNLPALLEMIEG